MRAKNMQSLTDDVKEEYPGVVVYGVGDEAHKRRPSDHNVDDDPNSKPAQTDKDTIKEHRAIDIMVGPAFTKANGDALVAHLLENCKDRLYGIIWHGSQWWRSTGFKKEPRTTDRHDDHVHVSGLAADDENTAGWLKGGDDDMFCKQGDKGEKVQALQYRLQLLGYYKGALDGDYGPATTAAVKAARAAVGSKQDGTVYDAHAMEQISIVWSRYWAREGDEALIKRIAELEAKVNSGTPQPPTTGDGITFPMTVVFNGTINKA